MNIIQGNFVELFDYQVEGMRLYRGQWEVAWLLSGLYEIEAVTTLGDMTLVTLSKHGRRSLELSRCKLDALKAVLLPSYLYDRHTGLERLEALLIQWATDDSPYVHALSQDEHDGLLERLAGVQVDLIELSGIR